MACRLIIRRATLSPLLCSVRRAIAGDKSRGPGYTVGGSAKAVSIPLPVSTRGAARSSEWRY